MTKNQIEEFLKILNSKQNLNLDSNIEDNTFDVRFWSNVLDFNVNMDSQLTSKSNLIFGASTFVFVFIVDKLLSKETLEEILFIAYH